MDDFFGLKTLRESYSAGIDFTVSKPPVGLKGRGRSNLRIVMMTPDCFKTLCMRSASPQANRVRAYFLAVEKTLFRYRAEIMEAMNAASRRSRATNVRSMLQSSTQALSTSSAPRRVSHASSSGAPRTSRPGSAAMARRGPTRSR